MPAGSRTARAVRRPHGQRSRFLPFLRGPVARAPVGHVPDRDGAQASEAGGVRVPERLGREARGSGAEAEGRAARRLAPHAGAARVALPGARDGAAREGAAVVAQGRGVPRAARGVRVRRHAARVPAGALRGARQPPAPVGRRQGPRGARARVAGALDPLREAVESVVAAEGARVRGPLSRSDPAHAAGGAERAAIRAEQRAEARARAAAARARPLLLGPVVRRLARTSPPGSSRGRWRERARGCSRSGGGGTGCCGSPRSREGDSGRASGRPADARWDVAAQARRWGVPALWEATAGRARHGRRSPAQAGWDGEAAWEATGGSGDRRPRRSFGGAWCRCTRAMATEGSRSMAMRASRADTGNWGPRFVPSSQLSARQSTTGARPRGTTLQGTRLSVSTFQTSRSEIAATCRRLAHRRFVPPPVAGDRRPRRARRLLRSERREVPTARLRRCGRS